MANGNIKTARLSLVGRAGSIGVTNLDVETGAHRFWRLYIHTTLGSTTTCNVENLLLYDIADQSTPCTYWYDGYDPQTDIYYASSEQYDADNAFRYAQTPLAQWNTTSTISWQSVSQASTPDLNEWLAVEFVEPKDIRLFDIAHIGRGSGQMTYAPTHFELQYSDDGSAWFRRAEFYTTWPAADGDAYEGDYYQTFAIGEDRFYVGDSSTPLFSATAVGDNEDVYTVTEANALLPLTGVATGYQTALTEVLPLTSSGILLDGKLYQSNSLYSRLPRFTASGLSIGPVNSTGTAQLKTLQASGIGYEIGANTGSVLLPPTSTAIGANGTVGTGQATLQRFTSTAFESLTAGNTLAPFTGAGAAIAGLPLAGAARLANLLSTGALSDQGLGIPLQPFTSSATGAAGASGSHAAQLLPFTSTAGASRPNEMSLFASTASGVGGAVFTGQAGLEQFASTAISERGAVVPLFTSTASVVSGYPGIGRHSLARFTSAGAGQFVSDSSASGRASLLPFTSTSYALADNIYSGQASLFRLIAAAQGHTGTAGTVTIELPLFTSEATGVADQSGTVFVTLPVIWSTATGTTSAPEIVAGVQQGDAIAMNLLNKAITEYDNFGFNSMTQFAGMTFAANSQGLFALGGDSDNGEFINASVRLGKTDFNSFQTKMVDYLYVGYSTNGDLSLKVTTDDATQYSYELKPRTLVDDRRHMTRVKMGKGVQGDYWEFGIDNVSGADFSLDVIDAVSRDLKRRIK